MKRQKIYGNAEELIHLCSYVKHVKPELQEHLIYEYDNKQTEYVIASLSEEEIKYIILYSNDIVLLGLMAKNLKIKPQ